MALARRCTCSCLVMLLACAGPAAEAPPASTPRTSSGFYGPGALAFDAQGRLWVANTKNQRLERFTPAQLSATGTPAPEKVLIDSARDETPSIVLDAQGGLWAASFVNGRLFHYTAAQLEAGGDPTADVVLTGFAGPDGLAFDARGNLWVSNAGADAVRRIPAASLLLSGAPTADVVHAGLSQPAGIQFDGAGNLWVASFGASTLSRIPAASVDTPSAADVTLTGVANGPAGLGFDSSGNLWFCEYQTNRVKRIPVAGLASSGSPTPDVDLVVGKTVNALAVRGEREVWVTALGSNKVFQVVQDETGGAFKVGVALGP